MTRPNGRNFAGATGPNWQDRPAASSSSGRKLGRASVTLVYGSRDEEHNAAVALKKFLEGEAADWVKRAHPHPPHAPREVLPCNGS